MYRCLDSIINLLSPVGGRGAPSHVAGKRWGRALLNTSRGEALAKELSIEATCANNVHHAESARNRKWWQISGAGHESSRSHHLRVSENFRPSIPTCIGSI